MTHLDGDAVVACAVDDKLRIVRWSLLAVGRDKFSGVHPIDAIIGAIRSKAKGVILVENRASKFSSDRIEFVQAVQDAGRLLGYPLLDHVIIGRDGAFWSRSPNRRHRQIDLASRH